MRNTKRLYFKKWLCYNIFCFILLIILYSPANAQIIFSENYDSIGDINCNDAVPDGWVAWNGCPTDTYQGITHYSGEISSPGRGEVGKSLKLWRHNGLFATDYSGYLSSPDITSKNYRELYVRYYMKVPSGFDVSGGPGVKFDRFWSNYDFGQVSMMAVEGGFHSGRFAIYCPSMGSPNYFWSHSFNDLGINDGEWHCIELHYKMNSPGLSDGAIELFINGECVSLKYDKYPDVWTPEGQGYYTISGIPGDRVFKRALIPGIGNTGNAPYVMTPDIWQAIEFDDYVVSTSYIGPDGKNPLPPPEDNETPSKATSLQEINVSSTQVNIEWNASTDNVGVTGYNIYRNGSKIGFSDLLSYSDNSVMPNTTYSYSVSALDAAANESDLSDAIQVTTPDSSYNSILFETWENNNINNWDDDLIVGDTHIDTNPVYGGNYAIKMESSNAGNYAHFFGDHPGVDGEMVTDVTLEEHYYLSPGFQFPSIGMKLWTMNCFESWSAGYNLAEGQSKPHTWAPYYMSISVYNNGQLYGNLTRADGLGGIGDLWHNYQQNEGSPVALNPGSWNKIKFRLKLNSLGNNDGVFQLWVNDELKCNYFNLNYRGTYANLGWNHLMMSMHANPSHPQSQWISRDNIHIFSGVEVEPKPSTPSAPGSLRIISE